MLARSSIFFCSNTAEEVTERGFGHLLSDLTVCALAFVFMIVGITANMVAITAYRRRKSLQTPSNYLLMMLSTFDVLLAVTGQPLYIVWKVLEVAQQFYCGFYIATVMAVNFFAAVSLIVASFLISLERYFSVFHPIMHRKHSNKCSIRILVVLIAITWALFLTGSFIGGFPMVYFIMTTTLVITCLLGTLIGYTMIFREISRRCSTRELVPRITDQRHLARERTTALNILFLISTMTIFYAPIGGCAVYVIINGSDWLYMNYFIPWAYLLVFASTAINPFLYGWKNRALRRSINGVLGNGRNFEETDV